MQVSYYAVHVPNYGLEVDKEKYRNKKPGKKSVPRDFELPPPPLNEGMISYAAMLEDLDTGFGMILDKIDELGIKENTYVIFTSDNGGGFRGNAPLQMGKADLWEDLYGYQLLLEDLMYYAINTAMFLLQGGIFIRQLVR